MQRGRRGVARLVAMQRVGDVEGGALAIVQMLEVGAERDHDLVGTVDAEADVGGVDVLA